MGPKAYAEGVIVGTSTQQQPPATVEELIGPELAAQLERLDVTSRKMLSGKLPGERRSKRRGRSVEFDDFRDYTAGDDLRHIDWNVLARLDRLFVKLFREEEDLALHLCLDLSPSMDSGTPSKLIYGARLTAALAYIGLVKQNRVGVSVFGVGESGQASTPRRLSPLRGRSGMRRVGAFLLSQVKEATRGIRPTIDPGQTFSGAMRSLTRAPGARGVMIVVSDFLLSEGLEEGLSYLGAATMSGAFDTSCVHLVSPQEHDPATARSAGVYGDLRLTDAETGRAAEVTISPESLARYRAAFEAHLARVKQCCVSRGVAHFLVQTSTPMPDLLLRTMRRGGVVG
ncbi:MAG: DUF58 domain-containing protein [Phycisphaeraceae bacterium]|nr:DUF58 domain-containing protein [Phycisphaeraceae bacterium]